MKVFKILLAFLVVMILLIVAVAATRPSEFRIAREIEVSAPPSVVFAQVNDFHRWTKWSPWEQMDPSMKRTYEGAAAGNGASYTWEGNDQVGAGRMTITGSTVNQSVLIQLDFLRPFAASNQVEFTFNESSPGRTRVAWIMTGHLTLMPKIVHLFLNMDKMVGADFEKGLTQMKAVAEASPGK